MDRPAKHRNVTSQSITVIITEPVYRANQKNWVRGNCLTMIHPVLVGIDVGGTFTDFVIWRDGQLIIHKSPTTPGDPSRAILAGLHESGLLTSDSTPVDPLIIVHGMTVATNALLERRGARTALLTTAGFGDVLVIGRQNRPHLYLLHQERPSALVEEGHRLEISERLDHTGAVLTPLDESDLFRLAHRIATDTIESLAIVLLFSYRNPAHERRVAEVIHQVLPDLPLSLSSEILPEYREFERTSTTVINAYVQPLVARYLARLEETLAQEAASPAGIPPAVRIMQSNGGVIGLRQAADQAARVVLSGPAGGVVGAFAVAEQAIARQGANQSVASALPAAVNLITFDMGGTSTDVALCPGTIPTTAESTITDLPLRLPVIDIHTVGAGGGSIAFIDAGGALQVGPQSAGAVPGPACYGRGGTAPTVTDANLVLGRLDAFGFLGGSGSIRLDEAAAQRAVSDLGAQLGLGAEAMALGIVRVANATMERALRRVSVERGHDPRQFMLLPFGGAGPLHACDLAVALGITHILCPPMPGVLSAYGMLMADITSETSAALLATVTDLVRDPLPLANVLGEMETRVLDILAREDVAGRSLHAAVDMRYRGQSYELTVPLMLPPSAEAVGQAAAAFHRLHAQRYGYAMEHEPVEVVTLRLRATAAGARPALPVHALPENAELPPTQIGSKAVWFAPDGPIDTPCYERRLLHSGHSLSGPAIVLQYDTTVVVAPGWVVHVDPVHNMWLIRSHNTSLHPRKEIVP